jgi:nucleoside-diphosphate-sugar epimerase
MRPWSQRRAGRSAVADLMEHSHQVTGIDVADPSAGVVATPGGPSFIRADLSNFGQAGEVLRDAAAVVHLADIASAGRPRAGGHLQSQRHHELQRVHGRRAAAGRCWWYVTPT